MTEADDELLPKYDRPPIGEVSLTVQFKPLDLGNLELLRLWKDTKLSELYPTVEEYAEMPPFKEVFGVGRKSGITMGWGPHRPIARYNFRNDEKPEQVQIQRDRFAYYWQRHPDKPYPHFPYILETFRRDFAIVERFCKETAQVPFVPNQCLIKYINPIDRGNGWDDPTKLGEVFTFLGPEYNRPAILGADFEDLDAALSFAIKGSTGERFARLYVHCDSEPGADEIAKIMFNLWVSGAPETSDLDGIIKFFAMGRRFIVSSFDAFTTPRMHTYWGKR